MNFLQEHSLHTKIVHYNSLYPAWYRMRIIKKGAISFLVQKSVQDWFQKISVFGFASAGDCEKALGLKFTMPREPVWGYNTAIQTYPCGQAEWVRYDIALPNAPKDDGLITDQLRQQAFAAAASISILTRALNGVREQFVKPYYLPQLILMESCVEKRSISGVPLGSWISPQVARFLAEQLDDEIFASVGSAMNSANSWMFPDQYNEQSLNYRAKFIEPCYVALETNAHVGLGPSGDKMKDSDIYEGYLLDMSNPDSVFNQLILIAGLAQLYYQAEKWLTRSLL